MNRRAGYWIGVVLLALAALGGIGAYAYNLGVARGLAQASAAAGASVPPFAPWGPWGYGFHPFFFPFFPVFPLLFILFWFVVLRALFWRGRWGGRCGEAHPGGGRRAENS